MKRDPMWRRYRDLLRRDVHADVDDEVAFHLEMREREAKRAGMTPSAAREAARKRFGDVASIAGELHRIDSRRVQREQRTEWWAETVQDLRLAVRGLRRAPVFAVTAIGTIALAIAANATVFSFVDALLFERLPYVRPEQLVVVRGGVTGTIGEALTLRERSRSFADVGIYRQRAITLDDDQGAARVDGASVTANLLGMLGAKPLIGTLLPTNASEPGNGNAVVLSYALWQRRYGGARNVIGRKLSVDGLPYTIVGVMPPAFRFPTARTEFWSPLTIDKSNLPAMWASAGGWLVARLRDGLTRDAAQREVKAVVLGMRHVNPLWDPGADYGTNFELLPFRQHLVGAVQSAALLLWACAGVVLLVACVNLANLLLARATVRQQELAIRSALGGGRVRLIRQLLTESLVLAVIGGGVSLFLTAIGTRWIAAAAPPDFPALGDTSMRASVYVCSALLTLGATITFGLLPAWRATSGRATERAVRFGRPGATTVSHHRVASALIIVEIAVAVMLTITGTLLSRSFLAIRDLSPGFTTDHVVVAQVSPPRAAYTEGAQVTRLYDAIVARASALPGVTDAAAVSQAPLAAPVYGMAIRIEGLFEDIHHRLPFVSHFQTVTPNYFRTLRIPIERGREFSAGDNAAAPPVAIVSQSLARRYWPDGDAVGKRIGYPYPGPWVTIVGIAKDIRVDSLRDTSADAIYMPVAQAFSGKFGPVGTAALSVAIRTHGDPAIVERAIRGIVQEIDRTAAVSRIGTMDDIVARSVAKPRFTSALVGAFAIIALILGGIGIYGVMSYLVSQRAHEMGVRAALGANALDIVRLVLQRGVLVTAAGAVIGILGALIGTRALQTLLFGVSPSDPLTIALVSIAFAVVALVASAAPARRAARVDPVRALRGE